VGRPSTRAREGGCCRCDSAIVFEPAEQAQLTRSLLGQLPAKAFLLADRLHGCAAFAAEALAACQRVGSHFLFRARSNIRVRLVRRFDDSHTPETAVQEIAALVLASALIARERTRAAAGQIPVLRLSFAKTLELLRPLWLLLTVADDLLSDEQTRQLADRSYERARRPRLVR
jgi:hypothetical protein